MAGFTSRSDLLADIALGQVETVQFEKVGAAQNDNNGDVTSMFAATGLPTTGAGPAAATGGTVYTSNQSSAAQGSMWFYDRSPEQKHLLSFGAMNRDVTFGVNLILYDRLVAVGSMALNAVTTLTLNTSAITRYTGADAINNEVWLETTFQSSSPGTFNLSSYTSADGTTGLVGPSLSYSVTALNIWSFRQFPLSDVKRGVRSVETLAITLAGGALTANLVILRPIAKLWVPPASYAEVNFVDEVLSMPRIYDGASLYLAAQLPNVVTPNVSGHVTIVSG
jgi:hypothetical protein